MTVGAGLVIAAADIADGLTAFATYTPTLYTTTSTTRASIAKTITRAVWLKRAGMVVVQVDLTAGATTTGGASVSLPVAAAARQVLCGSAAIMGAAAPAQFNVAFMASTLDAVIVPTSTGGFCDITSGQTFRFTAIYQG